MRTVVAAMLFVLLLQTGWAGEKPSDLPETAAPDMGPRFSVAFLAGQRGVKAEYFEPVYGSAKMFYRGEIGYRAARQVEIVLGAEYFKAEGELTFTKEPSTLTITPLELGARALLGKSKLVPYLGAGLGLYMIKEENVIGTVDEKKTGFYGEGGVKFRVIPAVFVDARVKYVMVKLETGGDEPISADLGGLAFAAGIGFSF